MNRVAFVFLVSAILAPQVYAQASAGGAILGTVTDQSGASVPGAQVTATNTATGQKSSSTTGSNGFYDFESMIASTYTVTIQKTGFQKFVAENVNLDAGTRMQINATLAVGSEATSITVQGEAVAVETASSESGGVVQSKQIEDFQLNGRNFTTLALLVPGVNSTSGAQEQGGGGLTTSSSISANGVGREFTNYLQDGAFNMNTGCQCGLNIVSPLETIAEFRIVKDNFSAKYPLSGSANIMVETKSGTNDFHGQAYEYLRNDKFDARNFFSGSEKPPLKQNIFGFEVQGPVRKNKLFFMGSEDWRRRHSGQTLLGAVPPAAIRAGDFTASPTLGKGGLKLDTTAITIENSLHPGVNCVVDGTHLNPLCFDPNSVKIMNKYWSLPNNLAGGFNNYLNNGSDIVSQRDDTYRADQYFGTRFALMGRISYETVVDTPPALTWTGSVLPTTGQSIKTTGLNGLLRFTANLSPKTINQTTYAHTYDKPRLKAVNAQLPSDLTLGLPYKDQNPLIPNISISGGWQGLGAFSLPVTASDGEGTVSNDFSHVAGSHVIQAGALYIFGIKRQNFFSNTHGSYNFSGVHTNDPMADYLLGLDSSFYQASAEREGYYRYKQLEAYVQDDWKVTKRLTLNLGVREVWYSPDTISNLPWTDFNPATYDPAKAPAINPQNGQLITNSANVPLNRAGVAVPDYLTNGLAFAGQNGVPEGVFHAKVWNLGPRAGFALDVFGDGKTSIRGGFGIGYSRIPFPNYGSLNNPPFIQSLNLNNGTLSSPAFGAQAAPLSATGLNYIGPPNASWRPTQLDTWSLTIERQVLPRGVASLAYVGSAAHFLKGGQDANSPLPVARPSLNNASCLQAGQSIPAGGFQFDPCINAGLASADYTRPFQGWGSFGAGGAASYNGNSNYNSLQAGWKYSGNLVTWTMAYTFGRALSDVASRGTGANSNTGAGAQNARDYSKEYGPVGFDRTHIFTSGYIIDLPFFRHSHGFTATTLGGWKFSGLTVIESGFASSPGLATSNNGLASRPNVIGTLSYPGTINKWFDTSAFAAPVWGFYGNAGVGIIRGPGEKVFNWALYKTFPITERVRLQFRSEFFNVFNHTNLSNVDTALGSGTYGKITSALDPRILEFALKVQF